MVQPTGALARSVPLAALLLASCIGNRLVMPVEPTDAELIEFESAGPLFPPIDQERLLALTTGGTEYVVVPGDVLGIQLPGIVSGREANSAADFDQLSTRVRGDGTIQLPVLGNVDVAGRSLLQVEETIKDGFHPRYVRERPNVVVTVTAYRQVTVAVAGAVQNPGIVTLRSDRLSLVGALMAAGGIDNNQGAGEIRIHRPGSDPLPVEMPVIGLNIPFEDLPLVGGETIVVERLVADQFSVIGLVQSSGAFPYPEGRRYSLMQALAIAGGVNPSAAPRFATVYRRKDNGEVVGCTFRIDGTELMHASNVTVKPGDVIAVDHTPGSWTRQLLAQILGFRVSFSASSSQRN